MKDDGDNTRSNPKSCLKSLNLLLHQRHSFCIFLNELLDFKLWIPPILLIESWLPALPKCGVEYKIWLKQEIHGLRYPNGLISRNIQEHIFRQKKREYK